MIILIVGILLIIVSIVKRNNYSPYLGFAFVFLIMGFQYNVKGDYFNYLHLFNESQRFSNEFFYTQRDEPFFAFLVKFFSFGSFGLFIVFISLFQYFVLAKFVDKYSIRSYMTIAPLLFFFTVAMMPLQMKAIRQGLSIELVLLAFLFADEKKIPWQSLGISLLAYWTHNSSLMLLPFVFLFWLVSRKDNSLMLHIGNSSAFPIVLLALYFLIYFIKERFLNDFFIELALSNLDSESRYSRYVDGSSMTESIQNLQRKKLSPVIVLYDGIMVYLVALYYQVSDAKMRVFSIVSIIAAYADMLFHGVGSLYRIIMYYTVISLVVYPNMLSYIKRRYGDVVSVGLMLLMFFIAMYSSIITFLDPTNGNFGTYKFIFME